MEQQKISYIDMVINKKVNYDESIDAIVPDLYPDIAKIIGVTATAYVKDATVQNDRILISGDLKCDVCYIPEGELAPVIMKVSMSFAHIEQATIENLTVNCKIELNKIEARIINPRKVSLLANVCIHTKAFTDAKMSITQFENDGYEILNHEETVNLIDSVNVQEFLLTDNVEFKAILTNDYEIYGIKPKIVINDTKILKNKLMIRGNVEFSCALMEEFEINDIVASSPFSQILDININDETLDTDIDVNIKSFDIENVTGAEFSYTLSVKTCITQTKIEKMPIVLDIYDTTSEILVNSTKYSLLDTPKYECEKCDFNVAIATDNIVDAILHTECQLYTKLSENSLLDCYIHLIGIYKSGKDYYDFETDYAFLNAQEYSDICFENVEITKNLSGDINLKIAVDVHKYKDERINIEIVETVERGVSHEKNGNSIILKYISSKTELWEIAKQYNTTMLDIIASNGLEGDVKIVEDTMLLIPVK
ncbi:MAG: DUF3794 domain-containing protein [Clostridia bacterium]